MEEEQKNEIAVWKPEPFKGSDLLPIALLAGTPEVSGVPVVGRENVTVEDMILPTLRLLQGQSQGLTEIEGAKAGMFLHSTTNELYESPIRALIVAHMKGNALFPKPDNPAYNGLERCLSRDGVRGDRYGLCEECRKCLDWNDRRPPLGSQTHSFVLMTEHGPAILRFSRTSYKAAKSFITTWNMSQKNLWAHPVVVTVQKQQKELPGGQRTTYFNMTINWQLKERVPNDAQRAAYELHKQINAAAEAGKFGGDDEHGTGDIPY